MSGRPLDHAEEASHPIEGTRQVRATTAPAHFMPSAAHRRLITGSIMLATIMQALDSTIANVALPHMQGSLSAASDTITWVLTSYIIAAAIMTPLAGLLAGRYGRKRLFLVSVAGFTVASMLCGIAGSLTQMVIYRLLQGIFGASLVPLSQSVLLDINPREKHGSAMAIWGAGIMVGPILGPMLGGWLTDSYNWRWVFYINLPVGIVAFAGILVFVRETARDYERPFDFFGFAMLSLGVGALQMMLDRGQQQDWFGSAEIIIECGLAIAGLYVFLAHSLTAERPFLQPALFKDRNFVSGLVLIFIVGIILLATVALLPPMLQGLMGYPVVATGLVLAPRGLGTMISMMVVGRLVNRIDGRLLMLCGLLLTAYSLLQMTGYSLEMDQRPIIISGIVQGLGLGCIFVPLSALTFATLAPRFRTEAAGVYSLVRNLGSSVGISVVESFLARNIQINHASLAAQVTPYNHAMHMPQVARMWGMHTTTGLMTLNEEVTRQASMIAYLDDFKLMMIVTLAAIPLLLMVRKPGQHKASAAAALD